MASVALRERPGEGEASLYHELLRRRECRASFARWCEEALRPYGQTPAAHHRLIIAELQAVAEGRTRRLMILAPPGSAKSRYTSQLFPAWVLARGGIRLLGASHGAELAEEFSGKIHDLIVENPALLGYGLRSRGVHRWKTTNGGEYLAAGVQGHIPGFRAGICILDDVVGGRRAADSAADRKMVFDWFNGDLERRLTPGAAVVVIMTPWHEADLAGELLRLEPERWRVVRMPAEAEADDMLGRAPGEWLWSEDDGYGYGASLPDIKAALSARGAGREWAAQYQGRPVPDTGDYFQKDWLRSVATLPDRAGLRVFGGSDYAVTKDGGDWTVHVVVGVDADDRIYLLDLWRRQVSSDVWVEAFCDLVIRWHPIGWAEELGQIKAGIGPWLDRRQLERRAFVARTAFPTRGDKAIRAQSIRGRAALSGLYVPAGAEWRADLEGELLSFPAGRHDDQVDALGLVGQLLDLMIPPAPPKPPKPAGDSWDRAFRRDEEDPEESYKTV